MGSSKPGKIYIHIYTYTHGYTQLLAAPRAGGCCEPQPAGQGAVSEGTAAPWGENLWLGHCRFTACTTEINENREVLGRVQRPLLMVMLSVVLSVQESISSI